MNAPEFALTGVRVLSAINSIELFGHERGTIEVFKALRLSGAQVRVGVNLLEHGGAVAVELQRLGFETFTLPFGTHWSLRAAMKDPALFLRNARALRACSRIFDDVIADYRPTHFHLGSAYAYSFLALALGRKGVPLIYRMGDCPPTGSPVTRMFWKAFAKRSTQIVANSNFVRRAAIAAGIPEERIHLIYNLAPAHPGDEACAHPIESCDAPPRLLYVGAISAHKGLVPLVEAVSLLKPAFPQIALDVLGASRWDGDFREELTRRIAALGITANVTFHGHVADPRAAYRRATLHTAPALWEEPAANVVLEAKREGLPSIVFRSGGLPELVRHGEDGIICEEKSAASLAANIESLLRDPARLAAMRAAALDDFAQRFAPARFVQQWARVYLADKVSNRPHEEPSTIELQR